MAQITQIEHRWEVSGDVLIDTVTQLLTASQRLTLSNNPQIDFAKVGDIDTATISLILEWQRRAKRENLAVEFVNLPANLTSLTQLYGVAELIN